MTTCDQSKAASGTRSELFEALGPFGKWDPAGVRARFGTHRGFIRLLLAQIEDSTGSYRGFKQIHWGRVKRVVFVCRGNICRSPYAERRSATYGLPTASFGLSARAGTSADPSASRIAARRGIELANHRACAASDFEFASNDLLVHMEPRQARGMLHRPPAVPCQVTLLGLWSQPRRPYIHDPHHLSEAYWERCFDVIDSGVLRIADLMGRRSLARSGKSGDL